MLSISLRDIRDARTISSPTDLIAIPITAAFTTLLQVFFRLTASMTSSFVIEKLSQYQLETVAHAKEIIQ